MIGQADINQTHSVNIGSTDQVTLGIDLSNDGIAKMMSILTSKLYSDPIGSIVREITSNCVDAHVAAANTKDSILIELNESKISFTDFGLGLSESEFTNIFCTLLKSTKDGTNKQHGFFGLGSKSPFSYTTSFLVSSRSKADNISRVWSLTKDAASSISATLLSAAAMTSEELHGTTVTVPIVEGDGIKFKNAIDNQLPYFDNVYYDVNVTNKSSWGLKSKESVSNDFKIIKHKKAGIVFRDDKIDNVDSLKVCIGTVLYPIDFSALSMDIVKGSFALQMNIGDVDITPNREQIHWTERSIANVKKALQKSIKFIDKKVDNLLDSTDDFLLYTLSKRLNDKSIFIDIGGYEVDVTQITSSKNNTKLKFSRKLTDDQKKLSLIKEVYRVDWSKRVVKSTLRNRPIESWIKQPIGPLAFTKRKCRVKMLHLQETYKNIFFIQIDPAFVPLVDDFVKSKYGGWVDDIVLPKSTISKYGNDAASKPNRVKGQIVCQTLINNSSNSGYKLDKFNLNLSDIATHFTGITVYGTAEDRPLLAAYKDMGFNVIMCADSNKKHFKTHSNYISMEDVQESKDIKVLAKNYMLAAEFNKRLPEMAANAAKAKQIMDAIPEIKNMLSEFVVADNYVRDNINWDRYATGNNKIIRKCLEGVIKMFKYKLTAAQNKNLDKLNFLNNLNNIKSRGYTSIYTGTDIRRQSHGLLSTTIVNGISFDSEYGFFIQYCKLVTKNKFKTL